VCSLHARADHLPLAAGAEQNLPRVSEGRCPEVAAFAAAAYRSPAFDLSGDGLPAYDATLLTQSKAAAAYFEAAAKACGHPKLVSNWIMGEVSRRLNTEGATFDTLPVRSAQLAALITRITDNTISNNAAKQVFDALWSEGGEGGHDAAADAARVDALIEAKGLKQMNDSSELEKIIDDVLAANPKNVQEFKAGNAKALNGLVGQIMKASKGKANPAQVNEMLNQKLG
jgi:aspartyl-tRNA(Asn)/glutamyl-tRNA(Gln) amidotransferase subunit B